MRTRVLLALLPKDWLGEDISKDDKCGNNFQQRSWVCVCGGVFGNEEEEEDKKKNKGFFNSKVILPGFILL